MKIFVPVKRVPDYEIRVKVNAAGDGIQSDTIKWIINPFDEIAIEEALRIREAKGGEVVVATVGPRAASEQLRTALALGADRAAHIVTDEIIDSHAAHLALAALIRREPFDLVLLGKQAIDSDANQTGQLLAATLDLPQATFASKVELDADGKGATVTREVDGGLETIWVALPAVVTTDLRLNTPRLVTLPNIVKAKKKPIEELEPAALGVALASKVKVVKLTPPPVRKAGVKVASVAELLSKLRDEAKVIP